MTENNPPTPNTDRVRTRDKSDSERTTEASETTDDTDITRSPATCPECDGDLHVDHSHGETRCADCGLVVAENAIDRGPDWQAFTAAEREQKSHAGSPLTPTQHDFGLSTDIDWRNQDANGNTIPRRQRAQLTRLRTWQNRARTGDSKERGLKAMLSEVQRMVAALDLPDDDHGVAAVICRRASAEDLLPGRSYEGIATAAVYTAIRQAGLPQDLEALMQVSRLTDEIRIKRTYRYLVRELELEVPPPDPRDYLPRLCSELNLSQETKRFTTNLLKDVMEAGIHSGKHPVGIAAAALYVATHHSDTPSSDVCTQSELAEAANVSVVTIRNRYHDIQDTCLPMVEI
jgi:transcription initiation factor TFIIB